MHDEKQVEEPTFFNNRLWILILITVTVITVVICLTLSKVNSESTSTSIAVKMVEAMYDFKTVDDLPKQYLSIKDYFGDEADWDRLSIDNELRVVNTYMQFKAEETHVEILDSGENFVAYKVENPNTIENMVRLFTWERDEGGKLYGIQEYNMVGMDIGGGNVLD